MNKNGKLLNLIFSTDSKKKNLNNINNQEFIKKLSSTKQKISDINFSDIAVKNSNFIDFNNFKSKKQKSKNNSKVKQNKNNNLITSLNDTDEKEENINDQIILKYQYYKYLSNNSNDKEKNNLKKKYIYGTKNKKSSNNSNIKKNENINIDYNKSNEFDKKQINRKFVKKEEKSENNFQKNNRYKKINSNSDNKIEIFLSSQIKNNVISKEDLLSLFNNNNSIRNKNTNNKNINNYTSTNPNNKNENNYKSTFNKNYEKSCPKLNFNKYASYRQGQNNINRKKFNYEKIKEENNENTSKISVRGNFSSNFTLLEPNNYLKNKINLNIDSNSKNLIKSTKSSDYNKNII